jgi:hypothetical protein
MQFLAIVLSAMVAVTGSAAVIHLVTTRCLPNLGDAMNLPMACGAGLILGLLLACAARCGTAPKLRGGFFVRRGAALMLFAAFAAFVGGLAGYCFVRFAGVQVWEPHFSEVPRERHAAFLAVVGSELLGAAALLLGGALLARVGYKLRRRAAEEHGLSL